MNGGAVKLDKSPRNDATDDSRDFQAPKDDDELDLPVLILGHDSA